MQKRRNVQTIPLIAIIMARNALTTVKCVMEEMIVATTRMNATPKIKAPVEVFKRLLVFCKKSLKSLI